VKAQPSKRAVYGWMGVFLLVGVLLLAGGVYGWSDEHSGVAGEANVTRCVSQHVSSRQGGVHCDATWTFNGRQATGWVQNARMNYEGRTISVRIHGTDHVTVATYWVPIGLALAGLAVVGVSVMVIARYRSGLQAT
jgi:hypothetical protein